MADLAPATDQDWASPEFDYLQPHVVNLVENGHRTYGGQAHCDALAQNARDERPYLIANIRRWLGNPKWDPRGASVTSLGTTPDQTGGE